jgi:uncharacterized protein (TIGR03032 family)
VNRLDEVWGRHQAEWRKPEQIATQWREAGAVDSVLLRSRASRGWWDVLGGLGVTLVVSREYEHLLMALTVVDGRPRTSYMHMPHPSGIAVDRAAAHVHVASTRNPNQVFELAPASGALERRDAPVEPDPARPLVPISSRFYPGALYIHDLAFVGRRLHANAVGENAVVALGDRGGWERVWWPRSIEDADGPDFSRNHLQLNSIAAGPTLARSYFSASAATPGRHRPGQLRFPVDRKGVLFSGASREPVATGLTRPHSARLHQGSVWVDDSGYGQLVRVEGDSLETVARLPGWTRGLCFVDDVAFVGTSRVIPRFDRYAAGLDVDRSVCGIHAVDVRSGRIAGSLVWPSGNQIFAVDWLPAESTAGLPFLAGRKPAAQTKRLFYGFTTQRDDGRSRR